jgi:hypothetical protein
MAVLLDRNCRFSFRSSHPVQLNTPSRSWINLNESGEASFEKRPLDISKNLSLFVVFIVIFSLTGISVGKTSNFQLPSVQLGHAVSQPSCPTGGVSYSECWYPAGPEMSTEQGNVFTSCIAEYTNLVSTNPSIDLTDCPVPAAFGTSQLSGPGYYLTQPIAQ